jgi:hypothetical protein
MPSSSNRSDRLGTGTPRSAAPTNLDGRLGRSRARPAHPGLATRHRLTVLAWHAADVVSGAGGLVFDRVGGGWAVEVYLAERADQRPLRILGVDARDLSDGFDAPSVWPDALVVAGELYERDVRVRNHFGAASRRRCTEIAIWGGSWPRGLEPGIGRVEHRLSTAAMAFKPYALEAAGAVPRCGPTESFRTGKRRFTLAAPFPTS